MSCTRRWYFIPEISLLDCQNLLQDSIVFANKFKDCLEYRPTIVAYKKNSKYSTDKLIFKCKVNKLDYFFSKSQIFGQVDNFFAIYTENDIAYYKKHGKMKSTDDIGREYHDTFVEKFCKLLTDIDSIKYPFISVCEPGINQERVENKLIEELQKLENVSIFLNKQIKLPEELRNKDYDIIVNASAMSFDNENEIYELKSSWVIKTCLSIQNLPEIAIIGERGTNDGMIQISPLEKGMFQVHCMRNDSTIIKTFNKKTLSYIQDYLHNDEIIKRSNIAIKEISKYFAIFSLGSIEKACPGIQRIALSKSDRISKIKIKEKDYKTYIDIITIKACSVENTLSRLNVF